MCPTAKTKHHPPYHSVEDLETAEDLERLLQGEPVEAGPLGPLYRALGTLAAEVRTLRAELRVEKRRSAGGSTRRLLSFRAAARALGVDRHTTLRALIASGQLRTVRAGGRLRVPAAEVERLAREGYQVDAPARSRTPRASKRGPSPGDAIRALKV